MLEGRRSIIDVTSNGMFGELPEPGNAKILIPGTIMHFSSERKDQMEPLYEKRIEYQGILTARAETGLALQLGWNYDLNKEKEVYVQMTKESKVIAWWFPKNTWPDPEEFVNEKA